MSSAVLLHAPRPRAEVVRAILAAEGIPTQLTYTSAGADVHVGSGESFRPMVRVDVPAEALERARELLAEAQNMGEYFNRLEDD